MFALSVVKVGGGCKGAECLNGYPTPPRPLRGHPALCGDKAHSENALRA
jgi:hypothetical protein